MSNYNIGLSGLRSNSEAIDTISNNIANSNTVGYKMGEFVFQDQFYKAINPLDPARAGMGVAKQNIRRIFTQGAVQSSANTLDMAITGAMGMFRLASNINPDEIYYTRNGQFAVSKEVDASNPKRSYIVNENGMYLTGYSSADGVNLSDSWTNKLTMPPTELEPKTTTTATLSVNLDSRKDDITAQFDLNNALTYSNKVSQTVYSKDDGGKGHTLTTYFVRVPDTTLSLSYTATDGKIKYDASSVADPTATKVTLSAAVCDTIKEVASGIYTITLTDGTVLQMTGTTGFTGAADAIFTATITQYRVFADLDGTVLNDANANFASDTAIPITGADPIALMSFWGGENIDALSIDPATFAPSHSTTVKLKTRITLTGGGTPDLPFTLDLTRSTSHAVPFAVNELSQDGNSVALLNSVIVDADGKIVGTYGDGREFISGQLVLVNFAASEGLVPVGNNVFTSSYLSGNEVHPNVTLGKPGEKGLGDIRSSAVEASNVDLANELVKLLLQQRMYSANSQAIRAFDDTLTTTIRMTGG